MLPSATPVFIFSDGDIILAALRSAHRPPGHEPGGDGGPNYWLFRAIHKFLLGHHSMIFANMFADGTTMPGETYEGVPLVEMRGDQAEDLATLLSYLYYPT